MGRPTTGRVRDRPIALNEKVSAQMSRMPRVRSRPEMLLRRELHSRGMRFRVNLATLPGRPDIAFTRARIAVFVDGCFWHMCPAHATMPKNNSEWWREKLLKNVERDRRKDAELNAMGWLVIHAWEHEDPQLVADEVQRRWLAQREDPSTGGALPR
ncbi:very short patch repair endonuclease [Actinoplanes xinjiangensis]|uniref:very short patch repair endonuclease n=1 Tax=Actinoplanes xinjiangensis TaxID=512350 RepID=UPI00342E5BE4